MFWLPDSVLSKKIFSPSCAFALKVGVDPGGADGLDAPVGLDAVLLPDDPPPHAASITDTEQITAKDSVRMADILFK
jgi:hypothetical protein